MQSKLEPFILDKKILLYDLAISLVGTPYKWGGNNPLSGMDCSGLVLELLRSVGAWDKSDTSAQGLYLALKLRHPTTPGYEFGDVLFFGRDVAHITHTAMYLGNGLMIEAGGGGSTTTSRFVAEQQGAYIRIRPVTNRTDQVYYVRPNI